MRNVVLAKGPGRAWVQLALIGDEPVGALFGFRLQGRVHVYQSGWDPDHRDVSVGLVQYAEAYRQVVETGGVEFDMCRGVDTYKLRFATDVIEEVSTVLARGVRGRLLTAVARRRWGGARHPAESDGDLD